MRRRNLSHSVTDKRCGNSFRLEHVRPHDSFPINKSPLLHQQFGESQEGYEGHFDSVWDGRKSLNISRIENCLSYEQLQDN